MDRSAATTLLARTAGLGEYFALPATGDPTCLPVTELLRESVIENFIGRTHHAISASMNCDPGEIPVRLAASSFQLGVAAKILSPVIGAAICYSAIPIITANSLKWRPMQHSVEFAADTVESVPATNAEQIAATISQTVLSEILTPFNDTVCSVATLSPKVAWGNVSSAANGAVTVLAMTHPEFERAGRTLVQALLSSGPLKATGAFEAGSFTRRSCCLFYQAPRSGLCGDCVLAASQQGPQH